MQELVNKITYSDKTQTWTHEAITRAIEQFENIPYVETHSNAIIVLTDGE